MVCLTTVLLTQPVQIAADHDLRLRILDVCPDVDVRKASFSCSLLLDGCVREHNLLESGYKLGSAPKSFCAMPG